MTALQRAAGAKRPGLLAWALVHALVYILVHAPGKIMRARYSSVETPFDVGEQPVKLGCRGFLRRAGCCAIGDAAKRRRRRER